MFRFELDRTLIRREAARRVGQVEEGFGLAHFEDDDYCLRLRRAGYRLVIAEDVLVHHDAHASFKANAVNLRKSFFESRLKFQEKWKKW